MDILLVEDDLVSRRVLEVRLTRRGHQVDCVGSGEEALENLSRKYYPMIFLDIGLPGMSGLDLNRHVRANETDPPIYVLVGTGETGDDRLREILDAGADDYVAKPYQHSILDTRMAVAEKSIENIREQSRLRRELTFLAAHDPLTGLYNRRQVEGLISAAQAKSDRIVLMQLDLDHFKEINDTLGHHVGDQHLIDISTLMQKVLPESAHIVRMGGDEFVAIVPELTTNEAVVHAEALINQIQEIKVASRTISLRSGGSIGITSVRSSVPHAELLREADAACYRAKSLGKNCAQVYVPFRSNLLADPKELSVSDLEESDHLELWFQPVCDLSSRQIMFHEALLRFIPQSAGPAVDAAMFMAEIYRSSSVADLDRFVVRSVCKALSEFPNLVSSINISASSICDWEMCRYIEKQLSSYEVSGERMILEITENREIPDLPLARSVVEHLSSLGVRFALDDLGTGFTSVTTLKHLPIGLVKVDGALIKDLDTDSFNRSYIEAFVGLSNALSFETVAEHIETPAEWDEAKRLGLTYGQGHLLGIARHEPYAESELGIAAML